MLVGECKGMKVLRLTRNIACSSLLRQVCDAKPIIRQQLVDRGDAIMYYEPESTVVSRSGKRLIQHHSPL